MNNLLLSGSRAAMRCKGTLSADRSLPMTSSAYTCQGLERRHIQYQTAMLAVPTTVMKLTTPVACPVLLPPAGG